MFNRGKALTFAAVVLLATAYAVPSHAAEATRDIDVLTVVGNGEARVVPDRAMVSLGVETRSARASDAIQENNQVMSRVVQAIRGANIPERNIQTATFNVSRQYEPPVPRDSGQQQPVPIFVVTNIIAVQVDDPNRVGAVIDAGTRAGANTVHGVSFISQREGEARQEALRDAVRNARTKAETIATALGVRLAGVESVTESGAPIGPLYSSPTALRVEAAATPILPGENIARASVTVRYRLAR